MALKRRLRLWAERVAKVSIYRTRPRGMDVAVDIGEALPGHHIEIVFDVGANVGQSAERFLSAFSGSRIYCFEPVQATFCRLQASLKGNDRIQCFRLALGSANGQGRMALQGPSEMRFLLPTASLVAKDNARSEVVEIATLDQFCDERKIIAIDYLKIDTEGGDLAVLEGARGMLDAQRIDFVEVEAGMNAVNARHVPFEILKSHLEAREYLLFGIYDQVHEWPTGEPHLRRTNSVFISRRMVEAHAKPKHD